jgi:hypothetical protein
MYRGAGAWEDITGYALGDMKLPIPDYCLCRLHSDGHGGVLGGFARLGCDSH